MATGQKISDGKAFNVTVPGSTEVDDGQLYRIGGINGFAIGTVLSADAARMLALEADPATVYSVWIPDALSPTVDSFLYWNDPTAFQYGRTNLKTTPQHDGDRPCFWVTKTKNAANCVQGRILNGVNAAAFIDVLQQARVGQLVDSSGGAAADGTLTGVAAPTDTPATADALRDDIAAVLVPAINAALKELATKINAIESALHASGVTL